MSRQEDFDVAAKKVARTKRTADAQAQCEYDFALGAEYGYQYALQHPHWIPVEEELPPASCGVISDPVLVFIGNNKGWCGYIREGFYNHAAKEWSYMNRGRTHKVTHWMEIQPPRKDE